MVIREAVFTDLRNLLELYTHLHENKIPEFDSGLKSLWNDILSDRNHHIIVGEVEGVLVSSCVVVIIKNLTNGQRPYALIENVITHKDFRRKGYASQLLDYAKEIATLEGCYKIMLMTSAKDNGTLGFYEKAGYNSNDKTGLVLWLF